MRVQTHSWLLNAGAWILAGGAATLVVGTGPAHANDAPVTFEYSICKDGICPSGQSPWLKATITNTTPVFGVDAVQIKLNSLLKSASELFPGSPNSPDIVNNVAVAFNFTEPIPQNIVGTCSGPGCRQGTPQFSVAENGTDFPAGSPFTGFDLSLFLAIPPASFDGSDEVTFTLAAAGLTASKFNTANASGYCTAAQVDGIRVTAQTASVPSTVIANFCGDPAPSKVPAPLPILGASMAFGFSRQLRRRVRGSGDSAQASIG